MADAIHAHPTGRHGLQKGALSAGAGPIDLIRQQHLGEDRTRLKAELGRSRIKHIDANQIGGQQIAGEAHPFERQAEGTGSRFRQRGLTHARAVLDQEMTTG